MTATNIDDAVRMASCFLRKMYLVRIIPAGQAWPPLPLARSSWRRRGGVSRPSKSTDFVALGLCSGEVTRSSERLNSASASEPGLDRDDISSVSRRGCDRRAGGGCRPSHSVGGRLSFHKCLLGTFSARACLVLTLCTSLHFDSSSARVKVLQWERQRAEKSGTF